MNSTICENFYRMKNVSQIFNPNVDFTENPYSFSGLEPQKGGIPARFDSGIQLLFFKSNFDRFDESVKVTSNCIKFSPFNVQLYIYILTF